MNVDLAARQPLEDKNSPSEVVDTLNKGFNNVYKVAHVGISAIVVGSAGTLFLASQLNVPVSSDSCKSFFYIVNYCTKDDNLLSGLTAATIAAAAFQVAQLRAKNPAVVSTFRDLTRATALGACVGAAAGLGFSGSTVMRLPTGIDFNAECHGNGFKKEHILYSKSCDDPLMIERSNLPNYVAGALYGAAAGFSLEAATKFYHFATRV
jgi:hypothetical protein